MKAARLTKLLILCLLFAGSAVSTVLTVHAQDSEATGALDDFNGGAQEYPDRTGPRLGFDDLGNGPVFVVPIEGLIDNALARYIDRAIVDAEAAGAAAVIFHIDTFGGLVDAADHIRKALLNAPMPTIAFIDRNAASAGALISYAAHRIVMVPGASIGAATVVEGTGGEAAPDKYQSYMRGLMRATAEARGRNPRIAEAMVDENLEVEGVSMEGQVLTLSTGEALRLGVADAEMSSIDELVEALELSSADRVSHQLKSAEKVLRFFASPVVQSILMLMMLGGLYFELQTPGVGFPGLMAGLGAAMFFGPHYLLGLAESWEMVLFVVGIALIALEIFVIPGFGVAGISGIVLVVFSLGVALIGNIGLSFPPIEFFRGAISTLAATMVLFVVLLFSLGRYLPRSHAFSQLVLVPDLSSSTGHTSADTRDELVGKNGVALTPLRPAGTAEIDGDRVDVVTSGEYISAGTAIVVSASRGSRVLVREARSSPSEPETLTS